MRALAPAVWVITPLPTVQPVPVQLPVSDEKSRSAVVVRSSSPKVAVELAPVTVRVPVIEALLEKEAVEALMLPPDMLPPDMVGEDMTGEVMVGEDIRSGEDSEPLRVFIRFIRAMAL